MAGKLKLVVEGTWNVEHLEYYDNAKTIEETAESQLK